ncbi:TIGR04283 family arsenosugar biosynthesis glycosyltransferase [Salisaeta longa]|uniref:TIGR04283 family arsenosugar biosynthesis glycosyltransferase n=1 Tax=Salisaeta longa TaxID=503170 RepID=UPI0003B3F296|nr:TIGR04283 family arsenosugar biosynthesis glycosyltransferase [Salisaeta longa]
MTVSVVIPTLNEAACLPATLRRVHAQPGPVDVTVVDGGSTDDTCAIAASMGASVVRGPRRGRAHQMNHGAAHTTGDALLFLHADTLLPPRGLSPVRRALASHAAGIFRLSFDVAHPLLRLYAWCTRLPWVRLCFGDRGLFVRRTAFNAVGGFPPWPIFEDLELAARLHRHGPFAFLPQAVTTSARRFERHGLLRQQLQNARLWMGYCLGASPERLAAHYRYDD